MSTPITLTEGGRLDNVALDAEELAILRQSGLVEVTPAWEPGHYTLTARLVIGRIGLPHRFVEIQPKSPIANLFTMLAWAAGRPGLRLDPETLSGYAEGDPILVGITELFTQALEDYLAHGLRRRSTPVTEATPFVRGKLLLTPTLRQPPGRQHLPVTSRTELGADHLLNQLLRQATQVAVETLADLSPDLLRSTQDRLSPTKGGELKTDEPPSPLSLVGSPPFRRAGGAGGLGPLLRRLDQTLTQLAHITPTNHPEVIFDRVHFTRLETEAAPALALARWLIAGSAPVLGIGPRPFPVFWLDMARLFEQFVAALLRAELADAHIAVQRPIPLDQADQVALRPDLVIQREGGLPLVLDTKYKLPGPPQPADLYQLITYCQALGAVHGVLVYPAPTDTSPLVIRHSGLTLHALDLDLGVPPAEFAITLQTFVTRILELL